MPSARSSPTGCACFFFSSPKRKQKKGSSTGTFAAGRPKMTSSNLTQRSERTVSDDDKNNELHTVLKDLRSQEVSSGGLFDVERTEIDFKNASIREKELTQDARKLLDMVHKSESFRKSWV